MGSEHQSAFSVRWQHHETNLKNQFDQLLTAQSFVDATLVCNDICIRLHKSVMAASSTYLRNILLQVDSRDHPVIILQDVDEMALQGLVTFMYQGVVEVAPGCLPNMVRCAETLKINGFLDAYRHAKTPSGRLSAEDSVRCEETNDIARDMKVPHSPVVKASVDSEQVQPVDLVDVTMNNEAGTSFDNSRDEEPAPPPPKKSTTTATTTLVDNSRDDEPEPPSKKSTTTTATTRSTNRCSKPKRTRKRTRRLISTSPQPSSSKASPVDIGPPPELVKTPSKIDREVSAKTKHEPPDDSSPSPAVSISVEDALENDEPNSWSTDPDATQRGSCGETNHGLYPVDLPPLSPSSFSCGLQADVVKREARSAVGPVFTCRVCERRFGRKHHLIQHLRTHDPARDTFYCEVCNRGYHRRSELHRHQKTSHLDSNSNSNS